MTAALPWAPLAPPMGRYVLLLPYRNRSFVVRRGHAIVVRRGALSWDPSVQRWQKASSGSDLPWVVIKPRARVSRRARLLRPRADQAYREEEQHYETVFEQIERMFHDEQIYEQIDPTTAEEQIEPLKGASG